MYIHDMSEFAVVFSTVVSGKEYIVIHSGVAVYKNI